MGNRAYGLRRYLVWATSGELGLRILSDFVWEEKRWVMGGGVRGSG